MTKRAHANAPTPERLAKGDIEPYVPRDFTTAKKGARDIDASHRVRVSHKNPLAEFISRRLISDAAYCAGRSLGSAYERATREVGAINLDGFGGGAAHGLTHARAEAMSDLQAMLKSVGETEHDRLNRSHILIAVCAERRSIREVVGDGARARQTASNMLCIALERLARHLALTGEAT